MLMLLVPSAIKLVHVFEHHEHEVCKGGETTHIHNIDLDCEFQKFQLNKNFTLSDISFAIFKHIENSKTNLSQYHFLNKYQRLHFSLRGPPALI